MQTVSQAWKDNQKNTLVSESDIEISLKMTDPDAYEDASADDNGHAYYADTDHIVSDGDKNITPYATLENNQWLLDGSRKIVPNSDYGEVGYVGTDLCTADKTYSANPIVTISFTQVHSNLLQGVTIRWSEFLNEYATEFIVTAYNGETVVATQTVTDNTSVQSVVTFDISDYDKITVEVVKWSIAYRRARIDEIFIGVNKVFSKKDIFSYDCSQSVDPISAELPKAEVSFSIDNLDASYNPYNAEGLSKYLIERQEINVRYGYKLADGVEWISGGKYYISEWDAEQNGIQADFKARDLLEFMTGTYYKGVYDPNGETSLYDLAESVLQDAGLPLNSDGSVKWVIDERLQEIYTKAPLPIDTHANCLQMIANASESVFYQDRDGTLYIGKIGTFDNSVIENEYICPEGQTIVFGQTTELGLKTSRKYTLSFYAWCETNYSVYWDLWTEPSIGNEELLPQDWFDVTPTPTLFQWTFTVDVDFAPKAMLRFVNIGRNGEINNVSSPIYVSDIRLEEGTDYAISYFNSYSKSGLSLSKPLKQVDVPCYSYSMAEQSSELYKGILTVNGTEDVVVTYSGAAANTTAWVDGGTLNSVTYYANACVLNITANGDVTITVTGYTLETSSVMVSTISGASGETVSVDNPLITSQSRARAVGKWVEAYMRNRMTLSSEWRADPRLEALDIVDNENDYDTNKVLMTNVKYSYNGAFRGSGEGRVI